MKTACRRILRYGDGWMTCCRAQHPEELVEQLGYLREVASETGDDATRLTVSYQVTLNIGDSEAEARTAFGDYIAQYYPELSKATRLDNWGPVGSPDQIIEWFRTFAAAGVHHFICRFGSLDQFGQVERFARDVLPALREVQPGSGR
jgi:alkanesulfonate monooxygenase SsuD/methylene tetrahydromethanopterin reductase-like flavin-dependent oxidoreductase (luciferase family)